MCLFINSFRYSITSNRLPPVHQVLHWMYSLTRLIFAGDRLSEVQCLTQHLLEGR